jgi:hypothetical protein
LNNFYSKVTTKFWFKKHGRIKKTLIRVYEHRTTALKLNQVTPEVTPELKDLMPHGTHPEALHLPRTRSNLGTHNQQ